MLLKTQHASCHTIIFSIQTSLSCLLAHNLMRKMPWLLLNFHVIYKGSFWNNSYFPHHCRLLPIKSFGTHQGKIKTKMSSWSSENATKAYLQALKMVSKSLNFWSLIINYYVYFSFVKFIYNIGQKRQGARCWGVHFSTCGWK